MSYYQESVLEIFKIENDPFKFELTEDSPRISTVNPYLKVPLRAHQAAAVHKMIDQEKSLSEGWDVSGYKIYSKWSILGDGVGVGKSLTVMAHIAHLKSQTNLVNMPILNMPASPVMFSMQTAPIYDISRCNASLIIVPHTLFRQWADYSKDQTKLKVFKVQNKKSLQDGFWTKLFEADVILICNTLYPSFSAFTSHIHFNRVYFDEADSLKISGSHPLPKTDFFWLISASWPNLLFSYNRHWINHLQLSNIFNNQSQFHKDFLEKYKSIYQSMTGYYHSTHHIVSTPFFNSILANRHPLRGRLVIRSSIDFIKTSIQLPQLFRHSILCRAPYAYTIVRNAITPEITQFLHAGDIQSALQALGVQTEGTTNLIEAVTENRKKELERLRKTYDFKASMEYSTPLAKETALLSLQQKMTHLEEQIKNIHERISNYESEACPICFDDPQEAVLTKCCQRVFCAACILTSLTRMHTCPLCRAETHPRDLRKIGESSHPKNKTKDEDPHLLLKKDALLKLLSEHPTGKFLIFSRYDNAFTQIQEDLTRSHINVKEVKGNKDVIQSILTAFQTGSVRCLLLNSVNAGAGLTITAATHVIILHSMSIEEEKQILGRAYRLGRTAPLHVYKLLHPDEVESVN